MGTATITLAALLLFLLFYKIKNNFMETDEVTDGTELLFTLIVFRHGDRTVTEDTLPWVLNEEEIESTIRTWGFGQLTHNGMRRGYDIGKFIRKRYDSLLSETYNYTEVYIRSTDYTRAKMTVLTAMAAVYPSKKQWKDNINWDPVPYTTVPVSHDSNLATVNCPISRTIWRQHSFNLGTELLTKHSNVLNILADIYGHNITYLSEIIAIYKLLESMKSFGFTLDERLTEDVFDEICDATDIAMHAVFADETNIQLNAGVLLNEFFESAISVVEGKSTRKIRIHSAHDLNVMTLLAATGVPRQGPPKYGAIYSLELRRILKSGKLVVLPVFVSSPEKNPIYLQVKGCDVPCDFDKFHSITSKYSITEKEWRIKCNITEDTELDDILKEKF